jgi:hypothetical protein
MKKLIGLVGLCALLTGCGDDPFSDYSSIKDTDYALIRLEMQRCSHVDTEGSFTASMRWSPKTDCLKHLQTRIVSTGNKLNNEGLF